MSNRSLIFYSVFLPLFIFHHVNVSFASIHSNTAVYVDPGSGNDKFPGSIEKPFRTIRNALKHQGFGGKIFLRGGIYRETNIKLSRLGALAKPLEIVGYPNEQVVIDGAIQEFSGSCDTGWRLHDGSKHIYETISVFKQYKKIYGHIRIGHGYVKLVSYENLRDLSSTNAFFNTNGSIYVGPGLYYSQNTGKIYIRLVKPPNLPQNDLFSPTINIDPDKNDIVLSPFNYGFIVDKCNSNYPISISGLSIVNTYTAVLISSSQNINIININFSQIKYGVLIKDGSKKIAIQNSNFNQNIPEWIAWSDVKISTKPAHSLQNNDIEINKNSQNILIENCTFNNSWDAINAISTANNLHIMSNTFLGVRDDCIQLGSSTSDVEIGHNKMIHVFTGISRHGSGNNNKPGSKYIHHNIIDSTKPMYVGRSDPDKTLKSNYPWISESPMMNNPPFGIHKSWEIGLDPFKIYNNTIIFRKSPSRHGAGTNLLGPHKSAIHKNEVYNNIFIQMDDAEILRNVNYDSGYEIYDGNIYYKDSVTNNSPIFCGFNCDATKVNFYNFETFINSNCIRNSFSYYPKGCETNSLIGDPVLNESYIPSEDGPANIGAVDINDEWPGSNSPFKGALQPN